MMLPGVPSRWDREKRSLSEGHLRKDLNGAKETKPLDFQEDQFPEREDHLKKLGKFTVQGVCWG